MCTARSDEFAEAAERGRNLLHSHHWSVYVAAHCRRRVSAQVAYRGASQEGTTPRRLYCQYYGHTGWDKLNGADLHFRLKCFYRHLYSADNQHKITS